jgi:transcriptional regulator with XRE-family HTH domain
MRQQQQERISTARSRELGEALRAHRERVELRGYELAKALGWHPSKISRIESGLQWATEMDVVMVLASCHADASEFDRLRKMCRGEGDDIWYQPHAIRAADRLFTLVKHEATAGLIRTYEPNLVPGLLQTEEYARALFKDGMVEPQSLVDERVQVRMDRQTIHNREIPPQMQFFVHEQVLHNAPASNPGVMSEQLLKMALATARSACSVRVVPRTRCAQGAFGSSFRVMEFSDHRPVGYRDQQVASLFFEGREDIEHYRNELRKLSAIALTKEESRELLASLASFYE